MSIIRVPDTNNDSKDLEYKNLEAHVILCKQRYSSLEMRMDRIELKVDDIIEQARLNRGILIKTSVTIISVIITAIVSLLLKYNG